MAANSMNKKRKKKILLCNLQQPLIFFYLLIPYLKLRIKLIRDSILVQLHLIDQMVGIFREQGYIAKLQFAKC